MTSPLAELNPAVVTAVIEFLRDWLPEGAKAEYRRMMQADPERWSEDAHFQGGVIAEHALRGNGITEKVLGVRDLDPIWPELLKRAVLESPAGEAGDLAG